LPYLKKILLKMDFETLQTTKANPALLQAALQNKLAEF